MYPVRVTCIVDPAQGEYCKLSNINIDLSLLKIHCRHIAVLRLPSVKGEQRLLDDVVVPAVGRAGGRCAAGGEIELGGRCGATIDVTLQGGSGGSGGR